MKRKDLVTFSMEEKVQEERDKDIRYFKGLTKEKRRKMEKKNLLKDSKEINKKGNIQFSVVHVNEKPKNAEKFVIEYLKKGKSQRKVKYFRKFLEKEILDSFGKTLEERKVIKKLFHDKTTGAPDLIVREGDLIYFVEVKGDGDQIRLSQAKWAVEHPNYAIKYLFIHIDRNIQRLNEQKWNKIKCYMKQTQ